MLSLINMNKKEREISTLYSHCPGVKKKFPILGSLQYKLEYNLANHNCTVKSERKLKFLTITKKINIISLEYSANILKFYFLNLFIYLKGTETEISWIHFHFPTGFWGWTRLKQETCNSVRVSCKVGRDSTT